MLLFRGQKFLAIPEAAERIGVTRLTVYRWLRGMRRAPKGMDLADAIRDTRTGQVYLPEALVRDLRQAVRGARPRARHRRR